MVVYNLTFSQPHGRFLFPVISFIGIQLALGMKTISAKINSDRLGKILIMVLVTAFILCDLVAIVSTHQFYYNLDHQYQG